MPLRWPLSVSDANRRGSASFYPAAPLFGRCLVCDQVLSVSALRNRKNMEFRINLPVEVNQVEDTIVVRKPVPLQLVYQSGRWRAQAEYETPLAANSSRICWRFLRAMVLPVCCAAIGVAAWVVGFC